MTNKKFPPNKKKQSPDSYFNLSKFIIENAHKISEPEKHPCNTCNGLGIIGGHSGQTPESYEEYTEPCLDCSIYYAAASQDPFIRPILIPPIFRSVQTPYGIVTGPETAIEYVESLIRDDIDNALSYRE